MLTRAGLARGGVAGGAAPNGMDYEGGDSTGRGRALVGGAMGRLAMLRPGDRVAVGVSGGKDSLCLLDALAAHRRRAPFPYELVAVTVEQGKFTADIGAIEAEIAALGVPWGLRRD